MSVKWLQTPSCRSMRTASRKAAARSTRAARSASGATLIFSILPTSRIIGRNNTGARQAPVLQAVRGRLRMLLVVLLAGVIADHAADSGAAERADRAAAGDGG